MRQYKLTRLGPGRITKNKTGARLDDKNKTGTLLDNKNQTGTRFKNAYWTQLDNKTRTRLNNKHKTRTQLDNKNKTRAQSDTKNNTANVLLFMTTPASLLFNGLAREYEKYIMVSGADCLHKFSTRNNNLTWKEQQII